MLRDKINKVISAVLIVIMVAMVANVLWQVFTRFVLSNPSSFTDELSRYLMIWAGILGAAYVAGKNKHVAIDLISSKLNATRQRRLTILVNGIIIFFTLTVLIIGGFRLVYITNALHQFSPALKIPLAVVYVVVPISGILIIYFKIDDLLSKKK